MPRDAAATGRRAAAPQGGLTIPSTARRGSAPLTRPQTTPNESPCRFKEAVALVTGANRGIGRSFVQALLERGAAKVYAGARDPAAVEVTDDRVRPVRLDVTDPSRIAALGEELADVRLVVNNAGIARPGSPLGVSLDDARAELDVNYFGLIAMTQAFGPVLAANRGGAFVNVLSVASWVGSATLPTYAASKSAAWSFTNAARIELERQNIQVVGVHVGYVDTDLTAGLDGEKTAPAVVATAGLDGVESAAPEAVVDDISRRVKAGLSNDQQLIYPQLAREFAAQFE